MPDPLRIRIRPDWDTALTYDSLYDSIENRLTKMTNGTGPAPKAGSRPVFVGRETIIAPLVAEIAEPNKRGTYLISGYRGTGKTTLLIEALSRAKKQLEAGEFRLFPVVLNVSEVSASLGNASQPTSVTLDIDPRRLLTALIRQIRDGLTRFPIQSDSIDEAKKEALGQLSRTVKFAYEKATAVKFSVAATNATENTRTRVREFALALENKNLLKAVAAIAAAGALAFEAGAWFPNFGWLHAVALFLSGVFAISLVASYKLSHSEKWTDSRQTALEHDNSLQQLETDLKDILAELKKNGLRTVVVLEELDKIDDPKGLQLAAVIRYFKNLFTQAPALFFFVTDKSYFDIIASAIKRARRGRSYAVEHTFFTHRIFVGRPTTEESLKFISAIATEDSDRKAIEAVAETLGKPGRTNEVDQLGHFVRVVLFNAANHLFDLKNELRRFARNEEQEVNGQTNRVTSFVIDDQTLPPEQAALAVFQDLIVEKSRSFEIKGGRAYANETLADSLYAVFNELGSNQPQKIDSFFPIDSSETSEGLLLDEQLDLSEAARVREAVESLIGDLERGRAFQFQEGGTSQTFIWRDDAARAFRYVRQLQKHEDNLIAELQRNASLIAALPRVDASPHPLVAQIAQRAEELRGAPEPMSADAALAEQRQLLDLYGSALMEAFANRQKELADTYEFRFEQVAQGIGGSLHYIKPSSGDPRLTTSAPRGGVLLAFGETETLAEDVWSFIKSTSPGLVQLNRVALVHVIHNAGYQPTEILKRQEQWNEFLTKRAAGIPDFLFSVDVLPLAGKAELDQKLNEMERIAASLVGWGLWARVDLRPFEPIPSQTPPLKDALLGWLKSESNLFHIAGRNTEAFRFFERDVLEGKGSLVFNPRPAPTIDGNYEDIALDCMHGFNDTITKFGPQWTPLGKWLVESSRVILYFNFASMNGWTVDRIVELLSAGAHVIVTKEGALPPELLAFNPISAPAPPTPENETKAEVGGR